MRIVKMLSIAGVCVVIVGVAAVAGLALPVFGQSEERRSVRVQVPRFDLSGRGSEIGLSVRDVDAADVAREKLSEPAGASVDEVRSDSPAARAGIKSGDVIVEFDGEKVRGARQFSRLVEETPPGRSVRTTVMRGGQRLAVTVTPEESKRIVHLNPEFRELERLSEFRLPEIELPDLEIGGRTRSGRLGITTMELQPQLAEHFGVKDGVLVASVRDDSPAARAGVKAGDVITSVNGEQIGDGAALRRRTAQTAADVTLGVVRDRKEMTVKITIEAWPASGRARPV